jgi:signal transduction histidine kinase
MRPSEYNGTGHGLVGMRERVSMLGGRLETGYRAEGGFEVRATLPLEPEGK